MLTLWLILEAYDVILLKLIDDKMRPSLFLISRSVKALSESPENLKKIRKFSSHVSSKLVLFFGSTKNKISRVIIDQLPICSE